MCLHIIPLGDIIYVLVKLNHKMIILRSKFMNNTQKFLKTIRIFEIISITLLLLFLTYNFSHWLVSSTEGNIHEQHQENLDNCLLLKQVAKDCIEEGKAFHIGNIPHDLVKYKVYNKDDNIVFEYSLKNASSYEATITLSQDYKILQAEYSKEPEDFKAYDEYNQNSHTRNVAASWVLAIVFTILILASIVIISMIFAP